MQFIGGMTSLPWLLPVVPPRVSLRTQREGARRALNVAIAALGLVLTLPLMIVIAVLIKVA